MPLFLRIRGLNAENGTNFLGKQLVLFHSFYVLTYSVPDGVKSIHLVLHSHEILNSRLGQGLLFFHKTVALVLELFQLRNGRIHGCCILTGIKAKLRSRQKLNNGSGEVYMIRGELGLSEG